jgi:hypothetical protein
MTPFTEAHMQEDDSRYNGRSVCIPEYYAGFSTVTQSSTIASRDPHLRTGRVSLSPSPLIASFFIGTFEGTVLDRAAHKPSGNYVMWIYLHYLAPWVTDAAGFLGQL